MRNRIFKIKKYTILIIFFCIRFTAQSAEISDYRYLLIQKAIKLKLHDDPYWYTLLHYKKNIHGNLRSLIDDKKFFLALDGKTNPESELKATIQAFFRNKQKDKKHPTERFVARFYWLKEKLNFNMTNFPYNPEKYYNQMFKKINPVEVILVFSSSYIKSPASMYGHTLLLFYNGQNKLTSHVFNYEAETGRVKGINYAYDGLFGVFKGRFAFQYYYRKINQYNNMQMRDLWEYRLNLSQEELHRLLRHSLELHRIYSDYFYMDENCSYNLLYLIEAARPGINLTDYRLTVEPIETIKKVIQKGFLKEKTYRPSLYSKIRHLANKLDTNAFTAAFHIINKKKLKDIDLTKFSDKQKSLILDFSADYLQFQLANKDISPQEYAKKNHQILSMRSIIKKTINNYNDIEKPLTPDYSHNSSKISLGCGYRNNNHFAHIKYRPTYHDLIDLDKGLIKNSQILCSDIDLRVYKYENETKFKIDKIKAISILALPPSNRLLIEKCWKMETGLEQNFTPDEEEHLTFYMDGELGISTELSFLGQLYSLAGVKGNFNPDYKYKSDVGPVGSVGLLSGYGYWKSHIYICPKYNLVDERYLSWKGGVQQRINFTTNSAFQIEYSHTRVKDFRVNEILGQFSFNF